MSYITNTVRDLRNNETPAEKLLWNEIKNRKRGFKFKRQKPLLFYHDNKRRFFVVDFVCFEHKLVIELDGEIHKFQKEYDSIREEIIDKLGYRTIRFSNHEVLYDMNYVLDKIKKYIPLSS